MDPVEQVIAHVFVCIIGTLITALDQFLFICFEIGTSKNGVKRTSNSSTSALHSQVSTKVNMLYALLFFSLSYSVIFVSWYFMFALWVMLCAFDCCGRCLVDVVQVHIAHMWCPGTRPHLLLWVRVICIVWDHFDNGAPCGVTSVQTIVHRSPRPLCHGRMRGQHGSTIH